MTTTDPNAARKAARAQLAENQRVLYDLVERIASDMAELAENIRGRRKAAMEGRTTDLALVIRVNGLVTNALSNAGLGLLTDRLGAVMAVQRELAVMEAAEAPRQCYAPTTLEPRMLQKVRAGERGWRAGEELLVRWGATPRRPTQNRAEWLAVALGEIEVRRLRHGGNYRYAFTLGERRRLVVIGLPRAKWTDPETGRELAYPKRRDAQLPLLKAG